MFVLKVRKDRIEEYRERHRHVWLEMLDALSENVDGAPDEEMTPLTEVFHLEGR